MSSTPLNSVPPKARRILYWTGYVVGITGQGVTIVWGAIAAASPHVSMPLALVITSAVLGLLQTQLNLLAGSNVADPADAQTFTGELRVAEGFNPDAIARKVIDALNRQRRAAGRDRLDGA